MSLTYSFHKGAVRILFKFAEVLDDTGFMDAVLMSFKYFQLPILAITYFVAVKFGLSLAIGVEKVSIFWVANGVAIPF